MPGVTGRRHLRQHEDLFGGSGLWSTAKELLSFETGTCVCDGTEVELHLLGNLFLLWSDTGPVLILKDVKLVIPPWKPYPLNDLELHLSDPHVLLRVVHSDQRVRNLVRIEYVLVKGDSQVRCSLAATARANTAPISNAAIAAAGDQVHRLLQCRVLLERNRWFMNHKHLLVLKVLLGVRKDTGLGTVLHLSFWPVVVVISLPHYGRW